MRVCYMLFLGYLIKMEVFSLEDDEYSSLILTQSSSVSEVSDKSAILPDPMDFESPCVSLITKSQPVYSDISENDFEDIPCSQVVAKSQGDYDR